ncbi:hypothetical protein XELAEV_18039110mg [Xenopus laevis]|uniref:Uncharacterized protein n=1 Tax=Xenopus laevis TaxID=8355 RepID=A0A974C822_XENLA|nr:hypothetical protein XELAEV_18039110mg [Xenopus laevis]
MKDLATNLMLNHMLLATHTPTRSKKVGGESLSGFKITSKVHLFLYKINLFALYLYYSCITRSYISSCFFVVFFYAFYHKLMPELTQPTVFL